MAGPQGYIPYPHIAAVCKFKLVALLLLCHVKGFIVGRVFTNCPGDLGSVPDRVIPKTLKMVLDTSLLNTEQYKGNVK